MTDKDNKRISNQFGCFCSRVLKNEAHNIRSEYAKQREHETSLTELSSNELLELSANDKYFADEHIFKVLDKEIVVVGNELAKALMKLPPEKLEINSLIARDKELDNLFEHLYEDNVCGKINDDRFAKMSVKYESEQKEVSSRIKELQTELESEKSKAVTSDMFMASVRKYTRARKLTPRMLNELIEKIEVHQSEKIDGKTVQRLTIHYNCIGAIEIPDLDKLPENNVSVHTRQGVDVHYAACAS